MLTVAVMQPYFIPYAGYFRLFAATDLFVIYDCVQFPRRGWVHRNRLRRQDGDAAWLTLPLKRAPQSVRICELDFADDAKNRLGSEASRFPALLSQRAASLVEAIGQLDGTPVDYLERTLSAACALLRLPFVTLRSSSLAIDPAIKGADRIIAIAQRLGATSYVNAPGGRVLYQPATFRAAGVRLNFLRPYEGPDWSILQRLQDESSEKIAQEIRQQSAIEAV